MKTTIFNRKAISFLGAAAVLFAAVFTIGCKTNVTSDAQAFAVTFNVDGANGSLTAAVDGKGISTGENVTEGKIVVFTAVADEGYSIDKWTINEGAFEAGGSAGNPSASVKITKATTVTVSFTKNKYKVEFNPLDTNGTLSATLDGANFDSGNDVEHGKTLVFTASPNSGYSVATWTVSDGAFETGGSAGDKNASVKITKATTVTVSFTETKYTVTFDADGGSPVPDNQLVKEGEKASNPTTVPTKEGYNFEGWFNKEGNTAWDFDVNTVTKNTELYAKWEIKKYKVDFSSLDANGTLSAKLDGGNFTTGNDVEHGKTVEFTAAITAADYQVEKWTITGGDFESGTGTEGSLTASVKITAATTVNVTFRPADKTYKVDDISFTQKGINAVTEKTVGYEGNTGNPVHKISLSAYRMAETEVTQELWLKVMGGENPSRFKSNPAAGEVQGKRPVEKVTWFESIAFCNELTKKVAEFGEAECVYYKEEALTNVYTKVDAAAKTIPYAKWTAKGFRIPTESEWEWAAKGGTDFKWAGTDKEDELVEYAWYKTNCKTMTHQVKMKKPNGYGLYDMSGNVQEWCWDLYTGNLTSATLSLDYSNAYSTDPTKKSRIRRGGGWVTEPVKNLQNAERPSSLQDIVYDSLGIRLVTRVN